MDKVSFEKFVYLDGHEHNVSNRLLYRIGLILQASWQRQGLQYFRWAAYSYNFQLFEHEMDNV